VSAEGGNSGLPLQEGARMGIIGGAGLAGHFTGQGGKAYLAGASSFPLRGEVLCKLAA
jgi:hypothetical protein